MAKQPTLSDATARTRITTELTRSLLVEAGAGSGKTHEMAARMAAGVAAGVYDIGHMAAVTFTRKAAAELRGRFQLALESELAGATDAARRERVATALAHIERFFSGTIHAFCARLLRERPIEAEVAPGFGELDEIDERLMREGSWREFRARARQEGDADLALVTSAGIKAQDLDGAFMTVCLYEDVDFAAIDAPAPSPDAAWQQLGAFWKIVEKELPDPIADEATCKTLKKARRFGRAWAFAQQLGPSAPRLAGLLSYWDYEPGITQKWWSENAAEKKRLNALIPGEHQKLIDDVVTPWLAEWRQHLYAPCVRLLMRARAMAAEDRARRNVLSFNDLMLKTARLLKSRADVREALRAKYRWLFVDEFQDTDPLQAEIMFLLAGTTNPLFVVGDPKQSIYRFRRADIDIYNDVRARIAGADGTGVVQLTTNFRSVPELCTFANDVFKQRFPTEPSKEAPAFARLVPHKQSSGQPALFSLAVGKDDEPEVIARYIRSEVHAGRRQFGDFLILTRKRKPLTKLQAALETLQIPVEVSGAGAFGKSAQVAALSRVLQSLADPQDGVVLLGVLRGPLFGLSDRDLFAWKQVGGYFSLFSALETFPKGKSGDAAKRVSAALEQLRRWHQWLQVLPAGAALDRMLEDSGYLALAAASPGGVEAGDLLHAVDRVRVAVESGYTLAEAAESLVDAAEDSSEVESWPLKPGQEQVVRLMNLHKAKGLEAPVVILADPGGGYSPKPDVRVLRDGDVATGVFPIVRKNEQGWGGTTLAEPPGWDAHAAEEQRYLMAEEDRLLYVAATRAQDTLIVCRTGKNTAWGQLGDPPVGAQALTVPATVELPTPAKVTLTGKAAAAAVTQAETIHAKATTATWEATSVTAETKTLRRLADADGAVNDEDPTSAMTADTASRRADAGAAWGTLVHGLLEHAMRFPGATRDDLKRLGLWLTVEEPDLRVLIDHAVDTVEAVAKMEFWTEARAAEAVHEEVPFAVCASAGGTRLVTNGTIDLVFGGGSNWQVVDYKTDLNAGTAELNTRYAKQVDAYHAAWTTISGGSVTSKIVSARKT